MIALFDFDGVLMDTEEQYTRFWDGAGKRFTDIDNFGHVIKGQTLVQIMERYFADRTEEDRRLVVELIDEFERNMKFEFIAGAEEYLAALKKAGVPTAIVTSSNDKKMKQVYRAHPQLHTMVDAVLTSEHFSRSKPDPECFLKGMEMLGGTPETTVVFEDSIHGINAGRAAGAYVVGLATTNKSEVIAPLCNLVINDFNDGRLLHSPLPFLPDRH